MPKRLPRIEPTVRPSVRFVHSHTCFTKTVPSDCLTIFGVRSSDIAPIFCNDPVIPLQLPRVRVHGPVKNFWSSGLRVLTAFVGAPISLSGLWPSELSSLGAWHLRTPGWVPGTSGDSPGTSRDLSALHPGKLRPDSFRGEFFVFFDRRDQMCHSSQ